MGLAVIDWGSAPAWLSGVGALVALVFAFSAARAANKTNVQQGLQLRAIEEDRRQAHAALVAAWPVDHSSGAVHCRLHNGSELPVFGVLLFRGLVDDSGDLWWRHERVRAVSPGDTAFEWSGDLPFTPERPDDVNANLAAVAFLDCRGRYWLRDCFGQLQELPSSLDLYGIQPREWIREGEKSALAQLSRRGTEV